ncbi:uncharacterized protein LOC144476524 [Augochlora pura]
MCTCNHSTQCTEDYHTALDETDPSFADASWRTTQDQSTESSDRYCSAHCSAPSTPRSQIGIPLPFPDAPLSIPQGNLSRGLAVVRRLEFESYEADPDESSDFDISGLSENLRRLHRGDQLLSHSPRCPATPEGPPLASSSFRSQAYSPERSRTTAYDRSYVTTPERSRASPSPPIQTTPRRLPRAPRGTYAIDRRRRPFQSSQMPRPPPLSSTKAGPCVKCLRVRTIAKRFHSNLSNICATIQVHARYCYRNI